MKVTWLRKDDLNLTLNSILRVFNWMPFLKSHSERESIIKTIYFQVQ